MRLWGYCHSSQIVGPRLSSGQNCQGRSGSVHQRLHKLLLEGGGALLPTHLYSPTSWHFRIRQQLLVPLKGLQAPWLWRSREANRIRSWIETPEVRQKAAVMSMKCWDCPWPSSDQIATAIHYEATIGERGANWTLETPRAVAVVMPSEDLHEITLSLSTMLIESSA